MKMLSFKGFINLFKQIFGIKSTKPEHSPKGTIVRKSDPPDPPVSGGKKP